MSKFTSYDAPVQVGGPVNIPQASAADFGGQIGAAIETSGALLSDAVAKHKVRQDKRDVVSAHAQLSDFKLRRTRAAGEAMRNAGTGAPYVFDEQVAEFDEAYAEFTKNMTDSQRQAIAASADTFRYSALKTVSDFQAGEIVKADLGNMRAISLGIAGELHDGYRNIASAEADFRQILDASSLSQPAKEALVLEQLPIWRASLSNGWLANPVNGRDALASGEAKANLTDAEFTKFTNDLIGVTDAAADRALAEEQVAFATAHTDIFAAIMNAELTSTQQLEPLRGTISDELFNSFFNIVKRQTVPKRSAPDMEKALVNVITEFSKFDIHTKRGRIKFDNDYSGEDFIRFQNKLGRLVDEGLITGATAMSYFKLTQEALQKSIEDSGTTLVGRTINTSTFFNRSANALKIANEKNKGGDAELAGLFREMMPLFDKYIADGGDINDQDAADKIALIAQDNLLRKQHPDLAVFEKVPNAFVSRGKLIKASGSGTEEITDGNPVEGGLKYAMKEDPNGVMQYRVLDPATGIITKISKQQYDEGVGNSPAVTGNPPVIVDQASPVITGNLIQVGTDFTDFSSLGDEFFTPDMKLDSRGRPTRAQIESYEREKIMRANKKILQGAGP